MLLSDRDIRKEIEQGRIKVDPLDLEKQLMAVGLDLSLGNEFVMFNTSHRSHIDTSNYSPEEHLGKVMVKDGERFIIHPGEFVLGITKEHVELPEDMAGRIDGRSSLGRLGIIVHSTAGHCDPGFRGKLTLEITNIGKLPIAIYPGMKFCSLLFERLSSPTDKPYHTKGKYAGQQSPLPSRISAEFKGEGNAKP